MDRKTRLARIVPVYTVLVAALTLLRASAHPLFLFLSSDLAVCEGLYALDDPSGQERLTAQKRRQARDAEIGKRIKDGKPVVEIQVGLPSHLW
eukprot:SAG31_NODE_945_length_10834_cov_16.777084_5_plen_93_part_00